MLQKLFDNLDIKALNTKLAAFFPNLLGALILIIVFWMITSIVRKLLSSFLKRSKVPKEVQGFLLRVSHYAIVTVAVLTIADQIGINITSLLAGVGVAYVSLSCRGDVIGVCGVRGRQGCDEIIIPADTAPCDGAVEPFGIDPE